MAPEGSPVSVIQPVNGAVFLPQEATEGILAQIAVAFAAVLIGNVPCNYRWVIAVPLGKEGVDLAHLFPVDGGGEAVVVAAAEVGALTVGQGTQDLGVFVRHPVGSGTGGGGEDDLAAVLVDFFDDFI